jgi:hypothetical protein
VTRKEMIELREAALARLKAAAKHPSSNTQEAADSIQKAIAAPPSVPQLVPNEEHTTAIGWRDQNTMHCFNARAPYRQQRLH